MTPSTERLRKAAVLIGALDAPAADAVLERMLPEHASLVRRMLFELPEAAETEEAAVIDDFFRACGATSTPETPAAAYLSSAATPAPATTAVGEAGVPFEFLHAAPVDELGALLAGERPQTVAVVISHLPSDQAARIVAALPAELQTEVVRRLAHLDEADPEVLREVEQALQRRFRRRVPLDGRRASGVDAVRRIFDEADPEMRRSWLGKLSRQDPKLAANLTKPTFGFAELTRLADESWQRLVSQVEPAMVTSALAGAEPEFAAELVRRLPRADAQRLQRAIDTLGPTRLSDLDAAQDELLQAARDLEMQGLLQWRDDASPVVSSRLAVAA